MVTNTLLIIQRRQQVGRGSDEAGIHFSLNYSALYMCYCSIARSNG